jgi:hypothetical protein
VGRLLHPGTPDSQRLSAPDLLAVQISLWAVLKFAVFPRKPDAASSTTAVAASGAGSDESQASQPSRSVRTPCSWLGQCSSCACVAFSVAGTGRTCFSSSRSRRCFGWRACGSMLDCFVKSCVGANTAMLRCGRRVQQSLCAEFSDSSHAQVDNSQSTTRVQQCARACTLMTAKKRGDEA